MVNISVLKTTALAFLEDMISTERTRAMAAESAERARAMAAEEALAAASFGLPIGGVMIFAGPTAPERFLFARGQAVSRTVYPLLFGVCGITYGPGDGSTTFNIPDLSGRVPIGAGSGSGLTNRALGARGGAETHQLATHELPHHEHPVNITTSHAGDHTHHYEQGPTYTQVMAAGDLHFGYVGSGGRQTSPAGGHSHNVNGNTGGSGGNQGHNNMQPFLALNFIIRAL